MLDLRDIEELPVFGPPRSWKALCATEIGKASLVILVTNLSQYHVLGSKLFAQKMTSAILSLLVEKQDLLLEALNSRYDCFPLDKSREQSWIRKNPLVVANAYAPKQSRTVKPLTAEEKEEIEMVMAQVRLEAEKHFGKSTNLRKALCSLNMPDKGNYLRLIRNLKKDGRTFERFGRARPELSAVAKQKRLRFCKWLLEQMDNTPRFLEQLLHTDECSISLRDTAFGKNFGWWVKEGEDVPERQLLNFSQKFNTKIMVAACIGTNLKLSLRVFVEEQNNGKLKAIRENSDGYQSICLTPWFNEMKELGHITDNADGKNELTDRIFIQDGASSHTSMSSLNVLDEYFGLGRVITGVAAGKEAGATFREKRMAEWPPHSPDLNPLDFSLWTNLKYKVKLELGKQQKLYFDSLEHARETILRVWNEEVKQEDINAMCLKLGDKARLVVSLEGGTTEGYKANRGTFSVRNPRI